MSGAPRGYTAQTIGRRVTRPVHSRRAAVIEAAEAVFTIHDVKKLDQQRQDDTRSSIETHDMIEAGRK